MPTSQRAHDSSQFHSVEVAGARNLSCFAGLAQWSSLARNGSVTRSLGHTTHGGTWRRYSLFEPNKTMVSPNRVSFSGNDFSTGFIAREVFYTIWGMVDRHSCCVVEIMVRNWSRTTPRVHTLLTRPKITTEIGYHFPATFPLPDL